MIKKEYIINNERGSAVVIAMLTLLVVTILGVTAINNSVTELQIVRNEKEYQRDFYIAESGWQYGAFWLDEKMTPPPSKNNADKTYTTNYDESKIVRNFGDGDANTYNDDFPDDTQDTKIDNNPLWYNVQYIKNQPVKGSSTNYRKFSYLVRSNANKRQEIEVRLSKIYKVGYGS